VLNLKAHELWDPANGAVTLYGPFDMEGHRGTDGRYYLLDFHRMFPPDIGADHPLIAGPGPPNQAHSAPGAVPAGLSSDAPHPVSASTRESQLPPSRSPHLCQLLRPELVRQNASPLNSDAFSRNGQS